MAKITTSAKDVVWNYVGTVMSMAGNFLLLPLLLLFLSDNEIGLWYVFVAISNLTALFDFGFNPTFARNIVYVVSGARRLQKNGCDFSSVADGIDWHLLKTVMHATRILFAVIAVTAVVLVGIFGSMYVSYIAADMPCSIYWPAWIIFVVSIFLNLYYLRYLTFLRGVGDIASENKSKAIARFVQLILSGIFLALGFGLVGAAIGFFVNGLALRFFARYYFNKHRKIAQGIKGDPGKVQRDELKAVFSAVSSIAWRDGLVQLCYYGNTQATSIVCSLCLTLGETGTYSILLQLGTAVYHFSAAFVKSYYPMYQSCYAENDIEGMKRIVQRGLSAYYACFLLGVVGVLGVVFPLLPLFKSDVALNMPLFLFLALYLFLWNQHSIFCNFIVNTNRIPYLQGYVLSTFAGIALSVSLVVFLKMGVWGLVLGQALAQLAYNNWRWPYFVMKELETNLARTLVLGFRYWINKLI